MVSRTILLALAVSSAILIQPLRGVESLLLTFEDDHLRVHEINLAAGQSASLNNPADALLIPLGNGLDGRTPSSPVEWRAAGAASLVNSGTRSFSGLLVELVSPPAPFPPSIPPEALEGRSTTLPLYYRDYYDEGYRVHKVFENRRVLVTAHRLPQFKPPTEPFHWHQRELVFVYLSGGHVAGSSGYLEARRARRGEFDVLPADLPHVLQNVGSDPIDLLMITPK